MSDLGTAARSSRTTAPRTNRNGDSARVVRRRPGLPGGRAVVGGFLVAAAVVGIFVAYTSATKGPRDAYVVAATDLEVGRRIQASDLARVNLELPDALRGRAFDDVNVLVGATVVSPVARDELVQASHVVKSAAPPGSAQVSLQVPSSRALNGRIKTNETVDVLATYSTGNDACTALVAADALVVQVDAGRNALGDDATLVFTLALPRAADAAAVAHAAQAGQVTVVRATGVDPAKNPLPPAYRPNGDQKSC